MNGYEVSFQGAALVARGTGALWWPDRQLLCVSDLHLGKSERMARRGGVTLPPYDTLDTLSRLEAEIEAMGARTVICLGDSFDDLDAALDLTEDIRLWIARLQAGRRWIWIEGNHDPGPADIGGAHMAELNEGPLVFRHIAQTAAMGEVSGHYHPKAQLGRRGGGISRACFLVDRQRMILPAFGTYTGGLRCTDPVLDGLMGPEALAILTGTNPVPMPMPRRAGALRA